MALIASAMAEVTCAEVGLVVKEIRRKFSISE